MSVLSWIFWTIILVITHGIAAAAGVVLGIGYGEDKANRAANSQEAKKWRYRKFYNP